jgi:EAL and modified HD-GYP domain-containing signal transduction protein
VSLNVLSESLLQDLIHAQPSANVMIEIPAFMASDEANVAGIVALHQRGNALLLKGRPLRELPRAVLPCFKRSIIDLGDDRRIGEPAPPATIAVRSIPFVQADVYTLADMDAAFGRGAVAVLGWPMNDTCAAPGAPAKKGKPIATDLQVLLELTQQIDREDPVDKLEATLRRDPSLAFKLLRYMNSPGFGLAVEVSSFRHAIMLLGYARLKRWVALLLSTGSKDPNLRAVMFAALRRGMFMEELARPLEDEAMRSELFICGVFSLLDRMFQQPFSELLKSVPVTEGVYSALAEGTGPYAPYCRLVEAMEGNALDEIRNACDLMLVAPVQTNRALLKALANASELEKA